MISGEENIGSRYSQVACTFNHSSNISCINNNLFSHSLISSSKGLIKGEPLIVCVFTMWSSRRFWMSSIDVRIFVPSNRVVKMELNCENILGLSNDFI